VQLKQSKKQEKSLFISVEKNSRLMFYPLNTSVLNERVKEQKTITLSSLLRLNPVKVKYDDLQHEINR